MIEATKTGPGIVSVGAIIARNRAPTLALCRMLLEAGYPDQPMTVRDLGGNPLMTVRSIAEAAGMSVDEFSGCRFVKYRPFDRSNIDATGVGVRSGSTEGSGG